MADNCIYLIDATAFCYRAFYALPPLTTSFGQPTNAVYGFINMLNKILKCRNPEFLGVCFDVSRDTFRQKKFAEYKINRPPMPDGLISQIPLIKELISAYGISVLEKEGFEADDIIATMHKIAKENGFKVFIVSQDKDILQLVDDNTCVFSPYKEEGITYDIQKVVERYSVKPAQIPDIIALMGDDVDNIPGVPGIGEKTAIKLIKKFTSLENLLGHINEIGSEKIEKAIKDNIEKIKLNKQLALLDTDMDLRFDLEKLRVGKPDYKELFRLFKRLEFKKLLKDLPIDKDSQENIETPVLTDIDRLGSEIEELVIFGDTPRSLVFYSGGKFFSLGNLSEDIKKMLASEKIKKIGHDLKKIKVFLAREKIVLDGLYFDTMIADYLLNPSRADYDLGTIYWEHFSNASLLQSLNAAQGVNIIVKLKPILEKELKDKSLFSLFKDIEMPLASVLAEMELSGIRLDVELLSKVSREIEERLSGLIEDIYEISGCQFNINSPKQLREVLFDKLKLPVIKKTKTGPSTDEEVLRALAGEHKLPAILLEYRQLMKLKTTYVDTLPGLIDPSTGRVHTSFNQTATETGRLSSTNPNLQNIPVKTDIGAKIRQAIISFGEDCYLLSCDYSQIELRILAHLSGDENLLTAFKEGKDIHRITASLIYGIDENDITVSMREIAKRVNFGIVYGLTSYGLSRDLGISLEEAQNFIDAYFLRYPRVKDYIEEQISRAKKDGFVTTILARRRYIPDINNKNQAIRQFAQRQAVNTPIQGSASDLIKLAMINIHRHIKNEGLKTEMLLQIHDELVFNVPEYELKDFIDLARDKMENVLRLDVPIRVSIKKGRNWLEMEEVK